MKELTAEKNKGVNQIILTKKPPSIPAWSKAQKHCIEFG